MVISPYDVVCLSISNNSRVPAGVTIVNHEPQFVLVRISPSGQEPVWMPSYEVVIAYGPGALRSCKNSDLVGYIEVTGRIDVITTIKGKPSTRPSSTAYRTIAKFTNMVMDCTTSQLIHNPSRGKPSRQRMTLIKLRTPERLLPSRPGLPSDYCGNLGSDDPRTGEHGVRFTVEEGYFFVR